MEFKVHQNIYESVRRMWAFGIPKEVAEEVLTEEYRKAGINPKPVKSLSYHSIQNIFNKLDQQFEHFCQTNSYISDTFNNSQDAFKVETYGSKVRGVRVTHLPTGIFVDRQSDRSDHRNRDRAVVILKRMAWLDYLKGAKWGTAYTPSLDYMNENSFKAERYKELVQEELDREAHRLSCKRQEERIQRNEGVKPIEDGDSEMWDKYRNEVVKVLIKTHGFTVNESQEMWRKRDPLAESIMQNAIDKTKLPEERVLAELSAEIRGFNAAMALNICDQMAVGTVLGAATDLLEIALKLVKTTAKMSKTDCFFICEEGLFENVFLIEIVRDCLIKQGFAATIVPKEHSPVAQNGIQISWSK